MIQAYTAVWSDHLARVIADFRPDLIHSNHLWLVSSLVRRVAPDLPVTVTCHATGLRQRELCPHLVPEVDRGCRLIDHCCVLRRDHRRQVAETLGLPTDSITVIGAGYRSDLFHSARTAERRAENRRIGVR